MPHYVPGTILRTLYILTYFSQHLFEVGTIFHSSLQIGKLKQKTLGHVPKITVLSPSEDGAVLLAITPCYLSADY